MKLLLRSEIEAWATAALMLQLHGDRALLRIAEKVTALAQVGDRESMRAWRAVASRIDALTQPSLVH